MKYIVKDTHIRHGDKTYGPGEAIELSEDEAVPMAHHLEPVGVEKEPFDEGDEADEGRKRRKR